MAPVACVWISAALVAAVVTLAVDGVARRADPDVGQAVGPPGLVAARRELVPAWLDQCSVVPVKVQPSMRSAGTTAPPRKPFRVLRSLATATVPAIAAR